MLEAQGRGGESVFAHTCVLEWGRECVCLCVCVCVCERERERDGMGCVCLCVYEGLRVYV